MFMDQWHQGGNLWGKRMTQRGFQLLFIIIIIIIIIFTGVESTA